MLLFKCGLTATLLAIAVGCAPADLKETSETNDVVTDINADSGNTYIYFSEGSNIVRAKCTSGTVLFDRATCQLEPVTVPTKFFFQEVSKFFGSELPQLEQEKSAIFVKIQRIDVRLLDLMSLDPDPIRADLKPLIASKEMEIAENATLIATYADQIARMERELGLSEDPSLRLLLQDTQLKLSEVKSTETQLQKQLMELRQQYIAANASIFDPAMFNDLQAQRTQNVSALNNISRSMTRELDELVQMNRTMKMVIDQGFVYELRAHSAGFPDSKAVAGRFHDAFRAADIAYRTIPMGFTPNQRGIVFSVDRDATLETLECRFTFNPRAGCEGITIKGSGYDLYATGSSFQIKADYISHRELSVMRSINVKGDWTIAPVCRFLTTSGAPQPWTQFDCKFVVEKR